MINSRRIEDLHVLLQPLAKQFIKDCLANGITVFITQTYRDIEYQNYLYASGRTREGSIITKAIGGSSFHNYKLAFDIAIRKGDKIDWNDIAAFKKCGEIGKKLGLTWGGDFKSIKDYPHFQLDKIGWKTITIKDLRGGLNV